MAYTQFKPEVWAAKFQSELEKNLVGISDCTRDYEGEIKEAGDVIRIMGVNPPSIKTTYDGKAIKLDDPEDVADTSVAMPITAQSTFNFKVGDADKAQAVKGLMEKLVKKSASATADVIDQYIFSKANDLLAPLDSDTSYVLNKSNVFGKIDDALETLYVNNVKLDDKVSVSIPPWIYNLMKQARQELDTNNSQILEKGLVGFYSGVKIKMTNNTWNNGVDWKIMVKTSDAQAYVNQITKTEAYRPEKAFADAVKGLALYDSKIIAPKQLIVMHVKRS